jgi:hypothetical protein
MHLIEIFLPMYDPKGERFPQSLYADTRDELVEHFGGLTAHSLTPVAGLWTSPEGEVVRDDVIIYEVIAERVERSWWSRYRKTLEERFAQAQLMVRSNEIALL